MWGFERPRVAFMHHDSAKDDPMSLLVTGCSEVDVYMKLQLRMLLCCGVDPDDPRVEVASDVVVVPGHERKCDVLPVGYIAGDAWLNSDGLQPKVLCTAAMHMQERTDYDKLPPKGTIKVCSPVILQRPCLPEMR